ncbi:uncharacterized protein [Glycine max]|uniref:uncharacterized protein n=1 Tax=Glycine max TaxID=3847 RepID=UPI000719266E|nr:uncharacterized protein LOC102665463 [Glycine max]|eukprot:XP_014620455.1 uncharacterized protein LOC102665463 [Glycine max]
MSLEELVGIHKTHEKELAHDEGTKKRKSLVLMIQRPKHNSTSKELSSKALIVNNALEEESDDNDSEEKDEAPIRHITFEDAPLKQGFIGHIKMASRKCKSIGSRPTTQYDTRRFHSLDAWNRYTDNVLGETSRLRGRWSSTTPSWMILRLSWRGVISINTSPIWLMGADLALVKEFYVNLHSFDGPSPKQARVRGHLVKIGADSLNTFLETPVVLAEGETLPTYSRYCRLPTDYREIEAALCIPGRGFILNAEGHPERILKKYLTTLA